MEREALSTVVEGHTSAAAVDPPSSPTSVHENKNQIKQVVTALSSPCFRDLVAAYPENGRGDLKQADRNLADAFVEESRNRDVTKSQLISEIITAIEEWTEKDFRWRSGRVHSLKKFIGDRLWKEKPLRPRPVGAEQNSRTAARLALLNRVSLNAR